MSIQSFAAQSDQGPLLNINEDLYDCDFELELFMLVDGFGGVGVGDSFVQELKNIVKKRMREIVKDINSTMPFFYSPQYLVEGNALINALISANKVLFEENSKKVISQRGGASGIFAIKSESLLNLISIGNCRVYLGRSGKISRIFSEDSFRLLANDEYNAHLKSIPLTAIGMYENLNYQIKEVRCSPRDQFLFLTDGIYSRLSESEIQNILMDSRFIAKEKISELMKLSNQRGNLDNQSALILEF